MMLQCNIGLDFFVQCNISSSMPASPRCIRRIGRNPGAADPAGKGESMVTNFEDVQKFGRDSVEATFKSFGAFSKTAQTIAVEMADYSKKSFEEGTAVAE